MPRPGGAQKRAEFNGLALALRGERRAGRREVGNIRARPVGRGVANEVQKRRHQYPSIPARRFSRRKKRWANANNNTGGAVITTAPIPNGGSGGSPNIADFDGDKVPEVAAAGSSQYIVYKYAGGNAFTKLWSAATQDGSSQVTGSSVFDFDGDGSNEVVYNDEVYIRIYPGVEPDCLKMPVGPGCDGNMTDAEVLFKDKNSSRTRTEYPVIADFNGAHPQEPRQGSSLPPKCRHRSGNWRGLKTRRATEDSGGAPRSWRNPGEANARRAAPNRAARRVPAEQGRRR